MASRHGGAAVSEQWVGQAISQHTPLASEQVRHEMRRRDKHVSIWQPPEALPYLLENKNLPQSAHLTSLDSNTGVFVFM